jgi:hypothetical protein
MWTPTMYVPSPNSLAGEAGAVFLTGTQSPQPWVSNPASFFPMVTISGALFPLAMMSSISPLNPASRAQ